jgi:hypothetical protein
MCAVKNKQKNLFGSFCRWFIFFAYAHTGAGLVFWEECLAVFLSLAPISFGIHPKKRASKGVWGMGDSPTVPLRSRPYAVAGAYD